MYIITLYSCNSCSSKHSYSTTHHSCLSKFSNSISLENTLFIICWNMLELLHIPKNIMMGSYNPIEVTKAPFHSSPCLICTLLYPQCKSILVYILLPLSLSISCDIKGQG